MSSVECGKLCNVSANIAVAIFTCFPQPHAHLQLDNSPLFFPTNQHHQTQLAIYCLPYIRLPKTPNRYTFTLST
jgi:hypothetical protein